MTTNVVERNSVKPITPTRLNPSVEVSIPAPVTTPPAKQERSANARYLWALARLSLGWTFLWPFLDKTFGLGHQTPAAKAWIHGGSPTMGFLSGASGPFAGIYHSFAGAAWADWGFMLGLLAIAVALLLGIGTRLAAVSGAVLLVLMWSASLPPSDDVFMDNHIIYAILLIGLAVVGAGNTLGFGKWWSKTSLVRRYPWLI
jgi:thiosulfate dehydrogenase (quinone) large subunit